MTDMRNSDWDAHNDINHNHHYEYCLSLHQSLHIGDSDKQPNAFLAARYNLESGGVGSGRNAAKCRANEFDSQYEQLMQLHATDWFQPWIDLNCR